MTENVKFDFHCHTTASDGEETPAQLIALAESRGLSAIAITDHDTCESAQYAYGYARHLRERGQTRMAVVPGVELTTAARLRGRIHACHVLALGVDPYDEGLVTVCERARDIRRQEVLRKLEHVKSLGYDPGVRMEAELLASMYSGRGEFSRALVWKKRFNDVDKAYHALFDGYDEAPTASLFPSVAETVDVIHAAGGLAVWAHPFRDEINRSFIERDEVLELFEGMRCSGLDGIECFYRLFYYDDCAFLERLAHENGLLVSGGSDHHGGMKRSRLGITCGDGENHSSRFTVADALLG